MLDTYTYKCDCSFTFANTVRSQVRHQARQHILTPHNDNNPEPELIDSRVTRTVG